MPKAKRRARDARRRAGTPARRSRAAPRRASGGRSLPDAWSTACVVLGLWASIGLAGVIAYHASQLPPIDQLAVPKRPPNIAILASDGSLLANRGETGGRTVALKELPPYLPKAFVAIEDRRFYDHFGIDPVGIARAARAQPDPPRRGAGRLDADAAARQEPVPDPGAHRLAQDPGGDPGAVAGAQVHQGPDPRTLPEPGLFRRRRLWRRGGGAALFRQARPRRDARGGRRAGRPRAGALAAGPEPQPASRAGARRTRARGHERTGLRRAPRK